MHKSLYLLTLSQPVLRLTILGEDGTQNAHGSFTFPNPVQVTDECFEDQADRRGEGGSRHGAGVEHA